MRRETTAFLSGHANSAAMVARMIEIKQAPDRIVHAVTGIEFNEVLEFMDQFERIIGVEIIREDMTQNSKYEFFNFFYLPRIRGKYIGAIHGTPMTNQHCWHNRNVKQPVFRKYELISQETYTGFTVEERHRTSISPVLGCLRRFPLIEWQWTAKDTLSYLRRRGLPHILYEKYGFKRLGCCICPKQSDISLYIIYKNFPAIWERILEMEDKSPHGFRAPTKKTPYELMEEWDWKPPKDQKQLWLGCE